MGAVRAALDPIPAPHGLASWVSDKLPLTDIKNWREPVGPRPLDLEDERILRRWILERVLGASCCLRLVNRCGWVFPGHQQGTFEEAVIVCRDNQGEIELCQRAQCWRRCFANSDCALNGSGEPRPATAAQVDSFGRTSRTSRGLRKTPGLCHSAPSPRRLETKRPDQI